MHKIITRLMKLLTRRGVFVEEEGLTYLSDNDSESDEARVLGSLQAAARTYRVAFGPHAGQRVLTLQGAMLRRWTSSRCYEPISMVSVCTSMYAAALTIARRWSSYATDHPPGVCQRARTDQRCGPSSTQAEHFLTRRRHAFGPAAGVHATTGSLGAGTEAAPNPLSWCTSAQRQVARSGGATRGDVRARTGGL